MKNWPEHKTQCNVSAKIFHVSDNIKELLPKYMDKIQYDYGSFLVSISNTGVILKVTSKLIEKYTTEPNLVELLDESGNLPGNISTPWTEIFELKSAKNIPSMIQRQNVWDPNDFLFVAVETTGEGLRDDSVVTDVLVGFIPRLPGPNPYQNHVVINLASGVKLENIKYVLPPGLYQSAKKKLETVKSVNIYFKVVQCVMCEYSSYAEGLHHHKMEGVTL